MTTRVRKIFLLFGILVSVISACLGLETQRTNHLGWALLLAGTAFTSTGVITLGILCLHTPVQSQAGDRSLWLPAFGMLLIGLVTPLEYLYLPPVLARSDQWQDIGLILFAGGLCFYLLMLNSGGDRVKSAGIGKRRPSRFHLRVIQWFCRPIFASLMFFALGLSIGYSSLAGLTVFFLLILPGMVCRMKTEDRKFRMIG